MNGPALKGQRSFEGIHIEQTFLDIFGMDATSQSVFFLHFAGLSYPGMEGSTRDIWTDSNYGDETLFYTWPYHTGKEGDRNSSMDGWSCLHIAVVALKHP